ncbi:MAG TPA: FAD-dependent oxidoreductase [Noviherbaspirillum sp.]|uniref:FAD-dependent oxidoreductase n=1 Tax=Noviherbaspirillum sp. TaxID=1926288 RepID=UPI002B478691|nr:FAD-dependent oxidoreductase [Noviherbaspirillum sp.]HJV86045.1 FAD-dependent oxidoreductase [Noviherbaspirillum sp.]
MPSAIIVFSHLRWDFVFHRPQHLLSRLAAHYPVVFIEEPVHHESKSFFTTWSPVPNVLVCQPHTPVNMPGFHDEQLPYLQKLLRQLVRDYHDHIAWFYTPMALPLLQEMQPGLVVYDCIDEPSALSNAPKQLVQRENALLKMADIVFASGQSLYRAKRDRHPNVHCLPCSVDAAHFVPALDRSNSHPAHKDIPGPRLGFYGVIDERFDADLIAKVADAHSSWQVVLVGPVAKIDPASLPQRANIHYLGQQPYHALPNFLAGWDVCLLPYALNESTHFSHPAKMLEYMAAELPIVSTPVPDVVEAYGDIVSIAPDAPSFIAACEAALLASPEEQDEKIGAMRRVLASTSWDATVEKMRALLESMPRRQSRPGKAVAPDEIMANVNRLRQHDAVRFATTAIIGAGPTGLSAAYHLGHDAVLLERNSMVGGWCRSIREKGFTFDHAGHVMFSDDPYVIELYDLLLGSNLHWQEREAWVYSKNVHTRYPFQGALHGLPPEVIKECIVGAIEARYGAQGRPGTLAGTAVGTVVGTTPARAQDCCGDSGIALPESKIAVLENRGPSNFEEFIYQTWGAGIAKHFAIPYNRKLWAVPLSEMDTSWLGGRVPLPNLDEIIDGALRPPARPMGPNARFGYPLRGGFQALMSAFVPHIKGTIELNAEMTWVSPEQHLIALADGRRFHYDNLISTMPLPDLIRMIGDEAPEEVRRAAAGLRHISVRCVNLGVAREKITDKHWIYYPEDTIFHRIFVQGNASPECNPPGGFGLTCEISYSPQWKPLPASGKELIDLCIQDCIKVGMLRPDDKIIVANEVDIPYGYVVCDHARLQNVDTIRSWLARYDIILAGRYSEWEYYNSDHAFIAGKKAAESIKWLTPKKSALAAE